MSKTDLVYCLLNKQNLKLSAAEKFFVEILLFTRLYQNVYELFRSQHKEYRQLIKFDPSKEENMYGLKFMQEMVKDILSTKEYSLAGISTHTQIPEEILSDMVAGMNTNPTFEISRKIFEIHIGVRRELYNKLMQKIISEYSMITI